MYSIFLTEEPTLCIDNDFIVVEFKPRRQSKRHTHLPVCHWSPSSNTLPLSLSWPPLIVASLCLTLCIMYFYMYLCPYVYPYSFICLYIILTIICISVRLSIFHIFSLSS